MSPEQRLWYQGERERMDRSMQRQWWVQLFVVTALVASVLLLSGWLLWAILS